MAVSSPCPWATVSLSTTFYTTLLILGLKLTRPHRQPDLDLKRQETTLKAVSTIHATIGTALALYALARGRWTLPHDGRSEANKTSDNLQPLNLGIGTSSFDDTENPTIVGRSALGNAVTAWENGYLIYDTFAMLYLCSLSATFPTASTASKSNGHASLSAAVANLFRREPLMVFHHTSLGLALATLQCFIARGRERGVYVVVAFVLMNASTPLLNYRWYRRQQRTGLARQQGGVMLDVLLAVVFAACRFGSVGWVLSEYARFHGLVGAGRGAIADVKGIWKAFAGQRWICQASTASLVAVNALWLQALVKSIITRTVARGMGKGS